MRLREYQNTDAKTMLTNFEPMSDYVVRKLNTDGPVYYEEKEFFINDSIARKISCNVRVAPEMTKTKVLEDSMEL